MKKQRTYRSTKFYFIVLVMLEVAGAVIIASILTDIISKYLDLSGTFASILLINLFSIAISSLTTSLLSKMFFEPITKLSDAMHEVSKGNFDIRLETKSRFGEIQEIYSNFNLMTKELGATEILQTDFVSNVSHEFKTPINAIEGYATLLQCGPDCSPEEAVYTDKILFNTRRLSTLVNNILLLSKVDNQAISSSAKKYRLDEQVRQSVLSLEREWTEKDIELDIDLDEVEYEGNENLMFHVWNNIIANAIKFNPVGGLLKIRMSEENEKITCTVEDSGPGIDPAAAEHIFDKFYQSDFSHKEEGNGLGLALVKNILALSGGEVFAENRPEGGAKFTVIL
ncbi:MAG: HAMP domain-containing histidine kinase [Oscillospiraceae bacterium]|nr:HAMP domain-containing histidine kinase [Oscillospiraceae bacterium]